MGHFMKWFTMRRSQGGRETAGKEARCLAFGGANLKDTNHLVQSCDQTRTRRDRYRARRLASTQNSFGHDVPRHERRSA
jgi:hypothetical protein